jgi:hypothetical protein
MKVGMKVDHKYHMYTNYLRNIFTSQQLLGDDANF